MAIKPILPFNFDEIYTYIETKFTDRGYDTAEGSNSMQLVTAMSYLVSMLNANTAVNINETLLTQARKRTMVLEDARILGYEIEHPQSYNYKFSLNFSTVGTFSIKRYTSFSSGAKFYYYMGAEIPEFTVGAGDITAVHYYCNTITQDQSETLAAALLSAWGDDYGTLWNSTLGWCEFDDDLTATPNARVSAALVTLGATLKNYSGIIKQIQVSEGILHKYSDTANFNTLQKIIESVVTIDPFSGAEVTTVPYYIDVPFTDIEETGLHVFLTYIDEAGQQHVKEEWVRSNSFMIDADTTLVKEFIRLDSIEFRTPRIYFKLGEIGNTLRVGTLVYINALESTGILGEVTTLPTAVSLVCTVMEYNLSTAGAAEESTDSIKQNAPLFHNTANRIITKPDYVAFCNRQATVQYSDVWDGHYEYPQIAGYIWFSFFPATVVRALAPLYATTNASYLMGLLSDRSNWFMEDTGATNEIQDIFDYLNNFKVPTLIFQHRQPVYMNFLYDIEIIRYSAGLTNKEQHTAIFTVVDNYFKGSETEIGVETFKFEYFNSNLIKRIDAGLTDITGLNITLSTTIELTEKNIIQENMVNPAADPIVYYKEIRVHLGMPFEEVIQENGDITTGNIPDITTAAFVGTDILSVDYTTGVVSAITTTTELTSYDILLGPTGTTGDDIVGALRVFNTLDPDIELVFYVISAGAYSTGLTDLTGTVQMDVVYPSPNIKVSRNTIPRLKAVNFV